MSLAETAEVFFAGVAALVPLHAVVQVASAGSSRTSGESASLVSCDDKIGEVLRRFVNLPAVVEKRSGHRVGHQPPPDSAPGELSRHVRWAGSVSSKFRRIFSKAEQRR